MVGATMRVFRIAIPRAGLGAAAPTRSNREAMGDAGFARVINQTVWRAAFIPRDFIIP